MHILLNSVDNIIIMDVGRLRQEGRAPWMLKFDIFLLNF